MRRGWSVAVSAACAVAVFGAVLGAGTPAASASTASPTVQRVLGGWGPGDGGALGEALVRSGAVGASPDGSLVFYDDGLIRAVDAASTTIKTVVGGGLDDAAVGMAASAVNLRQPIRSIAVSTQGEISWSDWTGTFYSVSAGRVVRDIAFGSPEQLAYEPDGTLLVTAGSYDLPGCSRRRDCLAQRLHHPQRALNVPRRPAGA